MATVEPIPNDLQEQRAALYAALESRSIEPLWRALDSAAPKEPRVASVPHIWRWQDIREHLLRAGDLVTPQEAERRVLMLINPAYPAKTLRTVGLIYAGVQLIKPGETADSHRHVPNAQRFIMEGDGAFTSVDGEKTVMRKGDYVMTPSWRWHDHGNDSASDMIWLDGLDVPFVNILDANFFEDYEVDGSRTIPLGRSADDSHHRWARNMRPTWEESANPAISPIINYRWENARNVLHELRDDAGSPYDGIILQYVNPVTGGPTLPTMSSSLQLLRRGERTKAHRHTSSTIYHVAEGEGETIIGGELFSWQEGDTFVLPSWTWHEHESRNGEAVLFSYTDRPVIDAFGLYREEAHPLGHQS
jgi:gentisate 1,2-dioxygenase